MRVQGPPPPYHQTQRSSSVPGSMTSPGAGPGSPNGSAAGLSMPSPRAASGLNSPADGQRGNYPGQQQRMSSGPSPSGPSANHLNTPLDSPNPNSGRSMNPSNPGTPLAGPGPPHVSPGMGNLMAGGQSQPGESLTWRKFMADIDVLFVDGVSFGRQLQSFAQQKQHGGQPGSKQQQQNEPNLMPVPSPQQIQYLNTFEAQELTIQKQPNTSLRETDMLSPS